jgi:hypothetical protein
MLRLGRNPATREGALIEFGLLHEKQTECVQTSGSSILPARYATAPTAYQVQATPIPISPARANITDVSWMMPVSDTVLSSRSFCRK